MIKEVINNLRKKLVCPLKLKIFNNLRPGDSVTITYYIEGKRRQSFSGVLTAKEYKQGCSNFSVVSTIKKVAVCKKFALYHPNILEIVKTKDSLERQAKLYRLF